MTPTSTERGRRRPHDRGAARSGERAAPAVASDPASERSAQLLWGVLALLVAARAALAFVPSMLGWSLNVPRFLAPALAWGPWLIAAAALVPPLARRARPALEGAGEAMRRRPALAAAAWAALAAALALGSPDRVRFVGDFLLRQGTVEVGEQPGLLFPQALPLDVFLHYTVPSALAASGTMDANGAARLLGALEAAAARRARGRLRARARAARGGGGRGRRGGAVRRLPRHVHRLQQGVRGDVRPRRRGRRVRPARGALRPRAARRSASRWRSGLTLHRSALGLLPAFAAGLGAVAGAATAAAGRGGGPACWLALAVPLASLAIMLPRIIAVMRRWDAIHFTPEGSRAGVGGVMAGVFAGARPIDLANLVLMLSPLALALPVLLVPPARRRGTAAGELVLLLALALPFLAVMPFIHPAQGLFRDWDDFAATGFALSLLAAWAGGAHARGGAAPGLGRGRGDHRRRGLRAAVAGAPRRRRPRARAGRGLPRRAAAAHRGRARQHLGLPRHPQLPPRALGRRLPTPSPTRSRTRRARAYFRSGRWRRR